MYYLEIALRCLSQTLKITGIQMRNWFIFLNKSLEAGILSRHGCSTMSSMSQASVSLLSLKDGWSLSVAFMSHVEGRRGGRKEEQRGRQKSVPSGWVSP